MNFFTKAKREQKELKEPRMDDQCREKIEKAIAELIEKMDRIELKMSDVEGEVNRVKIIASEVYRSEEEIKKQNQENLEKMIRELRLQSKIIREALVKTIKKETDLQKQMLTESVRNTLELLLGKDGVTRLQKSLEFLTMAAETAKEKEDDDMLTKLNEDVMNISQALANLKKTIEESPQMEIGDKKINSGELTLLILSELSRQGKKLEEIENILNNPKEMKVKYKGEEMSMSEMLEKIMGGIVTTHNDVIDSIRNATRNIFNEGLTPIYKEIKDNAQSIKSTIREIEHIVRDTRTNTRVLYEKHRQESLSNGTW